ncbi:MAG: glycosyltransferase [Desulfobacteraceae bacterium]|nr:glycosyltransferase [Desulfobacteraceae bacterium]
MIRFDHNQSTSTGSLPLVSIFCFCKNAAGTIRRCIDSMLAQDYPNIEIVVQDGASTDGTLEILHSYDRRIDLVSEPDRGSGDAMFRVLRRINGEFFGSCLSDEVMMPTAVSWAMENFKQRPKAAAIYGDFFLLDKAGRIIGTEYPIDWDYAKLLSSEFIPPFCASFFQKNCFDAIDLNEYTGCGEFEFWARLGARFPIYHVPGIVAKYCVHQEQLSSRVELLADQAQARKAAVERIFADPSMPANLRTLQADALDGIQSWLTVSYCHANAWELARKSFLGSIDHDRNKQRLRGIGDRLIAYGVKLFKAGRLEEAKSYLEIPLHAKELFDPEEVEKVSSIWSKAFASNEIQPSKAFESELNQVIPAEIKNDAFHRLIQKLAADENVVHILEIGSSAGQGSTAAFVDALRKRRVPGHLYCLEISAPRFEQLQHCYRADAFVHCHQWSSVDQNGFADEEAVHNFYHQIRSPLNQYSFDRVLGWLRQDKEYIQHHQINTGGVNRIKSKYGIEQFDMVLIDGSEFTGQAELELVYGARFILLDDINTFKNHSNYQRLSKDPQYSLLAEDKVLRNGYAVFERRAEVLPTHFFTIVLNGMPFIEYHIEVFKALNLPWHWHIIEGVADHAHDTAWGKANGGRIPAEYHHNGLSVDGTTAYLDELARRHPAHITLYRPLAGRFWDGKLAMVSAPMANLPAECLLWQIDADELWTADQIRRMHAMFMAQPMRTAAHFHCHFFVGPELVTISTNAYSHHNDYEWFRVWRYRQGMRWQSHEPPRLMVNQAEQWRDVAKIHPFTHKETEAAGLVFTHYAYVYEHQVQFKEAYYGYKGAVQQWRRLQQAEVLPARLKEYLAWVKDSACADRVEKRTIGHGVAPVRWRFEESKLESASKKIHIVIDGVIFQLQHRQPMGISRVWRNLLPELIKVLPDARFTILERRGFTVPFDAIPRHTIAPYIFGGEKALDHDDEMLRRVCQELKADLFISTYFTRAPGIKNIVLVHDLIPEIMGHDLSQPEWRSKIRALDYADALAAISKRTLDDLKGHYPHAAVRPAAVVPNGLSAPFGAVDEMKIAAFRQQHHLDAPYVLMVGNRYLYKNGEFVFKCLRHPQWAPGLRLLCVGGEVRLTDLEERMAREGRAVFLPRLTDEELSVAYAGAEAYLCASKYEGFGLPILEAMACGCPVITTAGGALPETAGDAALYVDGDSAETLLMAIDKVRQPEQRREWVARGLMRAAGFSWTRSAESMAELILEVVQRPAILISAIVSTYNSERFMRGCLEDLLSQTAADRLEIVVIDSASGQNERAIVREFQRYCANIKYIRTQNREPLYAAWNRGIKLAQGKYVTSANTDDRHRRNGLEQMAAVLETQPRVALVYADVIKTATENETFSKCTPAGMLCWFDWDRRRLLSDGCFMGPQPMWRRSVHDVFRYFDESLTVSSDYEFWLRISQIFDFQRLASPLGLYLERADSVEHADHQKKLAEDGTVHATYLRALEEKRIIGFEPFEHLRRGDLAQQRQAVARIQNLVAMGGFEAAAGLRRLCNELNDNLVRGAVDQENIEDFIKHVSHHFLARHGVLIGGAGQADLRESEDAAVTTQALINRTEPSPQGGALMHFAEKIHQGIHLLLQNGHTEIAQWMLEKLVADFPQHAQAHHERAILAHKLSDIHTAAIHFKRAAELAPGDIQIQKSLGDFYHVSQGRTEEALAQYKKVLSLNPRELETLLTTAHLLVSQRRFDEARGYYEKVLAIDPHQAEARQILNKLNARMTPPAPTESAESLYQKATSQAKAGQRRESVNTLEILLSMEPNHASAHNDLGVLYYESGDSNKAQLHYEKAAELEPENLTYLKNLADFYFLDQANAEKALKLYIQVLTINPQDVEALMGCGYICKTLGRDEDARVFFNRVLEIEPWHNDAGQLLQQLDTQTAKAPVPGWQDNSLDLYQQAQDRAAARDSNGAVESLQQLIARQPRHAMAYNDLGVLFYEKGDKNQALRHYEEAYRLEPMNPTIMKNLADFYFIEQGRIEDALTLYVKVLESNREDTDALMAAGTICSSMNNMEDARIFYTRVLEIDPWHERARQELDRMEKAASQNFGSRIAAFGQKIAS